jgi:MFS family permease
LPSTFAALGARNFRLYWLGLVCYVLGHRAEYVTFAWLVWEVTRDPLYLGYLGFAQGVPLVVFQLAGGVLADRMDRLRLLLVTQLFTALTLAATFGLALAGDLRVAALLGLAALSNSFRAFDEPSRLALVPELIDRERLPNAIALSSIPWQAGRMIGPSVTGILIAAFGGTVGLALATLASFAALGLYSRLRLEAHPPVQDRGHALGQFIQGLAFIKDNFVFAALISLALFNAVFGLSYVTLLPVYADVYFGTGSTGFGLLNAAHGTGALTGTLTIATLGHLIRRPGVVVLMTAVGMGLSLVAFALSPRMGPAIAMLLALGFANTFYLTQVSTFIQSNVPDQLRGRVLAVYSLCWNLLPLGGLIAGGLAAAFDARVALVIGGALVAANALLLLSSRRLRAIR